MLEKTSRPDLRIAMRFDKAFPVTIGSEIYGDSRAVARNISEGGMFVELIAPPPIGSEVTVHFRIPGGGDFRVRAQVKHHYCLNFACPAGPTAARGIGLRFVEFVDDGTSRMQSTCARMIVMH